LLPDMSLAPFIFNPERSEGSLPTGCPLFSYTHFP
jgi:hypothetical protein